MSETALLSLAVLKAVLEEQRSRGRGHYDYFDLFVPFVAESLRRSSDEVVSVPQLQRDLLKEFGLSVPRHVLDTILRRVRSRGYITLKNKIYLKKPEKLDRFEFPSVRDRALQQHRDLVNALREFCADNHHIAWSEAQAQAALEAFVQHRHVAVVRAMADDADLSVADDSEGAGTYLVGHFVRSLLATGAREIEFLETVVQGAMLASAVFFPEAPNPERSFENTIVYCDTTFLLFTLGHAGEAFQAPCSELLDLLTETGATVACFEHTADEMRGILEHCAFRLGTKANPIAHEPSFLQYCLQTGKTSLDMQLASVQLETRLASLSISIAASPPYDTHKYVPDEEALSAGISRRMYYANKRTLDRDVQSISAIMRLRQGRTSRSVETCGAVLLTSNVALASVTTQFFRADLGPASIPPCLTDQALTSLIWLKRPTRAPTLARKWLIADCYAAVNPSRRLWQRYAEEMDKCLQSGTITDEQYYLMRYSTSAPAVLMEVTQGNEAVLTQAKIPELQVMLEERIRAEAIADKEAAISKLETALQTAEQQAAAYSNREMKRRRSIELKAARRAKVYFLAVKSTTIVLVLAASIFSLLGNLPTWVPAWLRWLAPLLGLAYSVLGAANAYCGLTLGSWLTRLESRFANWLTRRRLRQAGFEPRHRTRRE